MMAVATIVIELKTDELLAAMERVKAEVERIVSESDEVKGEVFITRALLDSIPVPFPSAYLPHIVGAGVHWEKQVDENWLNEKIERIRAHAEGSKLDNLTLRFNQPDEDEAS